MAALRRGELASALQLAAACSHVRDPGSSAPLAADVAACSAALAEAAEAAVAAHAASDADLAQGDAALEGLHSLLQRHCRAFDPDAGKAGRGGAAGDVAVQFAQVTDAAARCRQRWRAAEAYARLLGATRALAQAQGPGGVGGSSRGAGSGAEQVAGAVQGLRGARCVVLSCAKTAAHSPRSKEQRLHVCFVSVLHAVQGALQAI